jgi:chaperone modulatory protein CbpM
MITIEILCQAVEGLQPQEVERWIGNAWLRAEGGPGSWRFQPIDVARVRLIRELSGDLGIGDDALDVVLSLVDQLYAARRQMERVLAALDESAPEDVRETIFSRLAQRPD